MMRHEFFADESVELGGCEWHHGRPTITHFSGAVQVFAVRNTPCSVQMAATAFKVDAGVVVEAVDYHPWMYFEGPRDDYDKLMIEHEGE